MGMGGIGSSVHLAGEAFKLQARLFIVNIPYRGTAPAVADVVAGNLPMMFAPLVNTRGLIQAGKLRLLGVTSPQAAAAVPRLAGHCRDAAGLPVAGLVRAVRAGASAAGAGQAHQRRSPRRGARRVRAQTAGRPTRREAVARARRTSRPSSRPTSRAGLQLVRYSGATPD
jgi:hypothetical protein